MRLSPLLFVARMNWLESHNRVGESVIVKSCTINRLLFADDLLLLATSERGLQHTLGRFSAVCDQ